MDAENLVGATFLGFIDYSENGECEQAMLFDKEGKKYTVFALLDDDGLPWFHVQLGCIKGVDS
jgi:hypothetical protein